MKRHQNDQFNMLQLVETYLNQNESVWSSNVLISDAKNALSAKIAAIRAAAGIQQETTKGATKDKASLRDDLEKKGFRLSTALKTYAALNPDVEHLNKRLFITKSAFALFREVELLVAVEQLNEAAEEIIEVLLPYGITAATLIELMTARTAFLEMMVLPVEIAADRKEATQAIATLLREAIALLKDKMDGLVELLRLAEPEFVHRYFKDRRTHRTAHRKLALVITTVNAADNTPLAGAKIEVVGTNIKRISNENGHNKVRNLKSDYYSLSVSRDGFVPQTIPITILHGVTTEIVVKLREEVSKNQRLKAAEEVAKIQISKGAEGLDDSIT